MLKRAILALSTVILVSGVGYADTKTASSQVSLDYLPDCTISATDMDLGLYNFRTGASGTSTLRVKCNTSYLVTYTGYTSFLNKGLDQVSYRMAYTGPALSLFGTTLPQVDVELTTDGDSRVGIPGVANFINLFFDPSLFILGQIPPGFFGNITSETGDLYAFSGVVDPGQWVPAGSYQETVTFELEFPFDNPCQIAPVPCF